MSDTVTETKEPKSEQDNPYDAEKHLLAFVRSKHNRGRQRIQLTHPLPQHVGNKVIRDPVAVINIPWDGTTIWDWTRIGLLKGQEILDALKETNAWKRKDVYDIKDGDPNDPKQIERRRKREEQRHLAELEAELAETKAEMARLKGDPGSKEAKDAVKVAEAKAYAAASCSYCNWQPNKDSKPQTWKAALKCHQRFCKKKPATDKEAQEFKQMLAESDLKFPDPPPPDKPDVSRLPE